MSPWIRKDADEIDTDALEDALSQPWFQKIAAGSIGYSVDPSVYGDSRIRQIGDDVANFQERMDIVEASLQTDALDRMVEKEMQRIERAIRGAIRAGYDGVDINRPGPVDGIGIVSIEPWNRPEPDGDNGHLTERYTWDWFSDDELTRIQTADNLAEITNE